MASTKLIYGTVAGTAATVAAVTTLALVSTLSGSSARPPVDVHTVATAAPVDSSSPTPDPASPSDTPAPAPAPVSTWTPAATTSDPAVTELQQQVSTNSKQIAEIKASESPTPKPSPLPSIEVSQEPTASPAPTPHHIGSPTPAP